MDYLRALHMSITIPLNTLVSLEEDDQNGGIYWHLKSNNREEIPGTFLFLIIVDLVYCILGNCFFFVLTSINQITHM